MMEIFFSPCSHPGNKYIENITNGLKERNIQIENSELSKGLIGKVLRISRRVFGKKVKVFHYNWLLMLAADKSFRSYIKVFTMMAYFKLLKLFNKKIVWTMHNKIPHECHNMKLMLRWRGFVIKNASKIIIHCRHESLDILKGYLTEEEIKEKAVYIPHGNYIGSYPNSCNNLREALGIDKGDIVFMFVGQISRYKNVDILIKAFSRLKEKNVKLLVCGWTYDPCLEKEIESLCTKDSRIICKKGFIPDEELVSYLNTSDVNVMPFSKKSMLNSGGLILSLSYGKPVILPHIGITKDMGEKEFLFCYDYHGSDEHIRSLHKTMKRFIRVFEDRSHYQELCMEGYEYLKENNGWDSIMSQWVDMYKALEKR
ncbi:MAG: glycosyltransferase family 4 protein [Clostridia bacterium]|nr:glycosyltransferase family 4 protein [Clostridia bacterium]